MKKFFILAVLIIFLFETSNIRIQAQVPTKPPIASLNITGYARSSIAINSNTKTVYIITASTSFDGSLFVIDSVSNSLVKEIKLNANPGSVDVNSDTNKIYITTAYSGDKILVIDASNYTIIDTIKGQSAQGIGINLATNRIFIANGASDSVSVIDGNNNKTIANLSLSSIHTPHKIVVNQSLNKIYVKGRDGIAIIDGSTLKLIKEFSGYSSYGIGDFVLDSLQNKIYFSYFSKIQAINGLSDELEPKFFEIKNTNQITALTFSPSSHRIYALFEYVDYYSDPDHQSRITSFNTDTETFGDTSGIGDGKDTSLKRLPTGLAVVPSLERLFVVFPGKNLVNIYDYQSIGTSPNTESNNNTGTSTNKCPQGQELCSDGSCVVRKEECPTKVEITCPSEKPIKCPDEICVLKKEECSTTKCKSGEDLCPDGKTCVRDKSLCPNVCSSDKPFLCSTGTCVIKKEDCPVKPEFSCPPKFPFQCPNGVCVAEEKLCSKTVACPTDKPVSCIDNSCVIKKEDCPLSNGNLCPSDFPVQCSDGKTCVKEIGQCSEQCPKEKPFFCPDNTCTTNEQECKAKFADKCPPEKPFLCSDGVTCGNKKEDCPTVVENTCPVICPNNVCVKTKGECPVASCPSGTDLCPDGKNCVIDKSTCPKICPSEKPVLCPDNNCVTKKEDCNVTNENICPPELPVQCSDKTCVAKKEDCKKNNNLSVNEKIKQALKDLNTARKKLSSTSSAGRILSKRVLTVLTQIQQALNLAGIDCAIQLEGSVDDLKLILQEVSDKACTKSTTTPQKKGSSCIPQVSANSFKTIIEGVNNTISSILDIDNNENFVPDVCEVKSD